MEYYGIADCSLQAFIIVDAGALPRRLEGMDIHNSNAILGPVTRSKGCPTEWLACVGYLDSQLAQSQRHFSEQQLELLESPAPPNLSRVSAFEAAIVRNRAAGTKRHVDIIGLTGRRVPFPPKRGGLRLFILAVFQR